MKDDFFQALSHPCRREIIRLLKWKNLTAGEIAGHFPIAQPTVSRHLEVLKNAGIITSQRRGNQIVYSLVEIMELLGREEAAYDAET